MAEPIDHDALSSTGTAGWETVKGVAKAFGWVVGGSAVIVGGLAAIGAAIISAPIGLAALIGAVIGGGIGVAASVSNAPWITGIGALMGLYKGGERISKEQGAYRARVAGSAQVIGAKMNETAQAAYAMGQQSVVQELQKQQYMALQQQMEAGRSGGFADKVGKPCASKTEMIEQQAALAALAQPTR